MTTGKVIVGISIGSTYSSIGIIKDGVTQVIANEDGERMIPTCISFHDSEVLFGTQALLRAPRDPKNTIRNFTHLLGLKYEDEYAKKRAASKVNKLVQTETGELAFEIFDSQTDEVKLITIRELFIIAFQKLMASAEHFVGKTVDGYVLTVSPSLETEERTLLLEIAKEANFKVIQIVNEAPSSVLAYLSKQPELFSKKEIILVLDFGGFSLDLTLISLRNGIQSILYQQYEHHLGGSEFDEILYNHFRNEFRKKTGLDVKESPKASLKLYLAAERIKKVLSASISAPVYVESLYEGCDYSSTINRNRFEFLCDELFAKSKQFVKDGLDKFGIQLSAISKIIFVGGSTKIPKFQSSVKEIFEEEEIDIACLSTLEPDEVATIGASEQASLLSSLQVNLQGSDVLYHTAIETANDLYVNINESDSVLLLESKSLVPAKTEKLIGKDLSTATLFAKDNNGDMIKISEIASDSAKKCTKITAAISSKEEGSWIVYFEDGSSLEEKLKF